MENSHLTNTFQHIECAESTIRNRKQNRFNSLSVEQTLLRKYVAETERISKMMIEKVNLITN